MRQVLGSAIVALVLLAVPAMAQKPAAGQKPAMGGQKTATQFYMEYTAAFAKAKTIEEILPYMSKDRVDEAMKTPAAERAKMFGMIKMMNDTKNIKVTKETKTPTGYTLDVTGVSSEKKTVTGTVDIINEGGALKLKQESWKM